MKLIDGPVSYAALEQIYTLNKVFFFLGFNSRLNHDRNMVDYVKRNFDEIDRYGKFNKRPFREVEELGGPVKQTSSLGDEMAVINEYLQ